MSKTFSDTAAVLAQARKSNAKITILPDPGPKDLSDAYDIQDRLIFAMGMPVAGWKVGATGQAGMDALDVKTPVAGPIFASAVHSSPTEISAPECGAFIVEPEFAFQMGQDLLPKHGPFHRGKILDRVAGVYPVIEVVDTRFEKGFGVGGLWVVADGSANLAFVYGHRIESWRDINFSQQQVRLLINGKLVTKGDGAAALGDPLNVLDWLVGHLHRRGIALRAGDWVSTGLLTEVISIRHGDTCVADFGSLGQVRISRARIDR